nr:LacI family DNA-binding transcriptional regulator [Actinospica robiniae]
MAGMAGVSVGTASRALSGKGRMRPDTRDRVLEAATRLGFRPNEHARSLLAGRSWTVGLITTDGMGRFSTPVLLGAEDALGAGKIAVLLCDTRGDHIRERYYVETLVARRVDGIIVTDPRTAPRAPLAGTRDIPTVYAISPSTDPNDTSVVCDDKGGTRLAVEHLVATGRTRIAHVTGPKSHAAARDRSDHTRAALAAAGLELAGGRAFFGDFSEAWGRRAVAAVLRAAPEVDAIFCGNDEIARGVTDALREIDRRVPEEIAVVGYDNWEVMALAARPPLTTVDMNLTEIGRLSALHLLNAIDAEATPGIHPVESTLVVRESA